MVVAALVTPPLILSAAVKIPRDRNSAEDTILEGDFPYFAETLDSGLTVILWRYLKSIFHPMISFFVQKDKGNAPRWVRRITSTRIRRCVDRYNNWFLVVIENVFLWRRGIRSILLQGRIFGKV